MKTSTKNKIKKALQHLGIYVQFIPKLKLWYVPSASSFYKHIAVLPLEKQLKDLQKILAITHLSDDHQLYQEFLKTFIPDWNLQLTQTRAVAKNSSESFKRIVKTSETKFFEKLYMIDEPSLAVNCWFEGHIAPLFAQNFQIPKLQNRFSGELLSIFYYEWLDLTPIPEEFMEEKLIGYSKKLLKLSFIDEENLLQIQWPKILLNYEKLFGNYQQSLQKLADSGVNTTELLKKISTGPYALTHGDLHPQNAFDHNVLLDWDNFGYYPVGIDAAYLFDFFVTKKQRLRNPLTWVKKHYGTMIHPDFEAFQRNFLFFLFLNIQMRPDKDQFADFEKQISKILKNTAL